MSIRVRDPFLFFARFPRPADAVAQRRPFVQFAGVPADAGEGDEDPVGGPGAELELAGADFKPQVMNRRVGFRRHLEGVGVGGLEDRGRARTRRRTRSICRSSGPPKGSS